MYTVFFQEIIMAFRNESETASIKLKSEMAEIPSRITTVVQPPGERNTDFKLYFQ